MKRYYKHIAVGIVLFLLFAGLLTNCMLNNIKDTDSILHDDYQYLSLVDGAIAWETGVVRRLYDFGQIFPVYKKDKRGRNIIENYEKADQTSKLVRLIHAFFYRVPGSTGETDFGVTTQLAVDDLGAVKLVADIIAQCEQLQQQRSQFQTAVGYVQDLIAMTTDAGWLDKLGSKVTRNNLEQKIKDVQEKPWNTQAQTAFVSMCNSFVKNLEKELGDEIAQKLVMHQQAAQKFFDVIAVVNKNLRDLFKSEVFKKRESVESFILQALHECDPQNPDALYPPHTVEMILLAFVYKKYSYDRTVLKAFYDELNTQLGGKILLHPLDEQWVKESFAAITQVEASNTIETILATEDFMQSIKQHFAEFVYDAFQIRSFPAPVGYATSSYTYEAGKQTVGFADCMCNIMRNFINLYAYDAKQNKFTLATLQAAMNRPEIDPALAAFLKEFGEVIMADSHNAHNAWLTVISNIPYIAYNRTTNQLGTAESIKGYISIPENEQNTELLEWLKKSGYQMVENNQYGYELQPSVKNIIIVLDYLLQLNLFAQAGGLVKEFMRPDFIAFYFPKLCMALKVTGYLSTQKGAQQGEVGKDFDALDYTKVELYMTFNAAKITYAFVTSSAHGEFMLVRAEGLLEESKLRILLQRLSDFIGQPSLSLLVTHVLGKQDIKFDHLKNSLNCLYINLFAISLENTNLLSAVIERSFDFIKNVRSLKIKIDIKGLLMRLVVEQPDIRRQQLKKLFILRSFVESISDDDIKSGDTDLIHSLKDITEFATKNIVDKNRTIQDEVLELFRALIEKNQAFKEALEFAANGFVSRDSDTRHMALYLFIALFGKDQGYAEALQAAEAAIVSKESFIRTLALSLFGYLVEKGHALKEAMKVAEKEIIAYQSSLVQLAAINLLKPLMIKAPDETKKVIQKLLDDPNTQLDENRKEYLRSLLEQPK